MKATQKDPAIDALITLLTGYSRQEAIEEGACATCGEEASKFRDEVSEREYQISGMCQSCQDDAFGK
ncbi:MAG: hypothetical protein ACYTCN_08200 [Planctomycetota bacterium]|jgi:hypothetical protein